MYQRCCVYIVEDNGNSIIIMLFLCSLKLPQSSFKNLPREDTTGNATFKQGSRGTVIEATSRKDGKLKVKLDNDNTKTFRLIKQCDLQLYEGVALSSNSESQTEEQSFEY